MATPNATARAARRNAARNAPSESVVPDAVAEIMEGVVEDAETGPVIAAGAPENAATPPPASGTAASVNLSRRRVAGERSEFRKMALPQVEEDLTRKIDQGDMVMPKLRISQAMSATNRRFAETRGTEGVAMGSWYHSTSGKDLGDTVFFIPVDMRKSRAMFVTGQGLVCRSFDMLQGEGDPGIECEGTLEERHEFPETERGCSLRLWNRDGKTNTPPPCGVTYNFLGLIVLDVDDPENTEVLTAMLQLRSTGTKAARNIITQVMSLGGGDWSSVIMELGVEGKSNTKGTFYTPTAEFYDTTDTLGPKIQRRAAAFGRQMGAADLRSTIESEADTE